MMRLPPFNYFAPTSLAEAARILAEEGPDAMLVAGGTDLLPNMKRGQQTPSTLVSLRRVSSLRDYQNGSGLDLGAGLTLTELVKNDTVVRQYPGLWQAASVVATPLIRNTATLGGNICLDTRCNYYNQNEDWRKAINLSEKGRRDLLGDHHQQNLPCCLVYRYRARPDIAGCTCETGVSRR